MPPTGPDSIIATGRSVATSGVITPPFECMIERSPRKPTSPRLGFEALHIAADLRPDIGVHHRRRHALELAILAQDLVRQREIGVGQRLADDLAGDALVLGIDVGVQEADRDRLDAFGARALRQASSTLRAVERLDAPRRTRSRRSSTSRVRRRGTSGRWRWNSRL